MNICKWSSYKGKMYSSSCFQFCVPRVTYINTLKIIAEMFKFIVLQNIRF